MSPLRVAVAGVSGWLGRPLLEAIAQQPDMVLAAGVARGAAGAALDAAVPWSAPGTEVRETVGEDVAEGGIDVLVEVSSPEAALAHALDAVEAGTAVVVGTGGLDGEDLAVLKQSARRDIAVVSARRRAGRGESTQ